jgi:hypothetical protein
MDYKAAAIEAPEWLLPAFEIALVLVRLDHVARRIVNANHNIMSPAVELRVADYVTALAVAV